MMQAQFMKFKNKNKLKQRIDKKQQIKINNKISINEMTLVSRKKQITPCEANYFLYIGFLCFSLKPDQSQILKQSTECECLLRLYVK